MGDPLRRVDGPRPFAALARRAHPLDQPTWELLDAEAVRVLRIQPADLEAGGRWPGEEEANLGDVLSDHITRVLVQGATFADLGWQGASDAWLSRWWPEVDRKVREGLVRAGLRGASPLAQGDEEEGPEYPALQDGKLILASGAGLRGDLLAPTLAGWRQFLKLAPMSGLKYTALRQVADLWWQRKLPRGLLKGEPEAPEEPREASTEVAEESPHPSPAKAPEIPVMPASFIQHVVDQFNAAPGFRLRLEARPGEHRFVFVVTREGSDDVVASIDVARGQISDVRWLDSVRPGQQQALLDRLERALADAELADASNDDATVPNAASSLQPLIETIERMGHTYGMDLRGALDTSRKDPLHALAVGLKDLAEPVTTSPEALAERLEEADLSSAAEVLQDPDVLAFASVEQILDRLWGALDKKVPLSKIKRRGGGLVVPPDAFFGTDDARFVLVRESGRGTRYRLRRVAIKAGSCKGDLCAIEAPAGELRSGAEVYDFINQRSEVWINDLHDQIAALEHTLRDAPRLLADVRQLLLLAGALIDTHRCQGKEQAAALRAFEQAKRYHDAARRMLVAGKTAVAAERIHAAMRRIATAAAHISEDCAAGQQNFIPAKLPVDAADAAALEES